MAEFIELETLINLNRLKSFSITAEKMFTTQSNISKRIAKMESDLGKKLIQRIGNNISLSPEGEIMHEYAVKLTGMHEKMLEKISAPENTKGYIRIGVSESVVILLLPEILNKFQKLFPKVKLDLQVDTSINLREQLIKNKIDLALLIGGSRSPNHSDFHLDDYQIGWFVSKDLKVDVDLKTMIKEHALITFSKNTLPYVNLIKVLRENGISNYRIHNCASLHALINLTLNKAGMGIFPKSISQKKPWIGKFREIPGFSLQPLNYYVSYADTPYNSVAKTLADIAIQVAKK